MKRRYALLLDGGFVLKRLRARTSRPADASDVLAECRRIIQHSLVADLELLRIYLDHMGATFVHRDVIAHTDRVV
jgi:hypothetical protein